MIRYTHVEAKVDVYNQDRDIICFAGEQYDIVGIDSLDSTYIVEVEPDFGGYQRTIGLYIDDPDFYFLQPATFIEEIIEEVAEEIIEDFFEEEEW
jgi:hypothetical protein